MAAIAAMPVKVLIQFPGNEPMEVGEVEVDVHCTVDKDPDTGELATAVAVDVGIDELLRHLAEGFAQAERGRQEDAGGEG